MKRALLLCALFAAQSAFAAASPARSAMKNQTVSCRVREHKDITRNLRDEILGKKTDFLDAFYDVKNIEDAGVRPLVAEAQKETARWIGMLREKLKPRTVEVESERLEQSNYVIHFLINGDTRVEFFVDDVYTKDGCLHVRDQMRIQLLDEK